MFSGKVVILDEKGDFVEVRDLGPEPIATKPNRVVDFEKYKLKHPELFPEPIVEEIVEPKDIPQEVMNKVIQFLQENPDVREVIGDRLDGHPLE